jgi:hypothetical protein
MKRITCRIIIACAGLLVGCAASLPPTELIDARQACSHASASPATQRVPDALLKAREALALAEKSFRDDPNTSRTRALAILAYQEAKHVEALAATASDNAVTAKANKDLQTTQTDMVKQK